MQQNSNMVHVHYNYGGKNLQTGSQSTFPITFHLTVLSKNAQHYNHKSKNIEEEHPKNGNDL